MSPIALRPLMVLTDQHLDMMLGRIRLLGDRNVVQGLVAEPKRLTPAMVRAVADHLEEVLPVTYAKNLPWVQGQLFRRMSSTAGERVEFTSLHAWARAFCGSTGCAGEPEW